MTNDDSSRIDDQIRMYMGQRFGATPAPASTADISKVNEALTQWYLESAFFRDFVYRNPDKSAGKEFSDALIVFDDTLIIVQNKTQQSQKDPVEWAEKNINDALRQLRGSYRNLKDGLVTSFSNEFVGSGIEIHLQDFRTVFGLVVLAHESPPYEPNPMVNPRNTPECEYAVLSLNDLLRVADRMDTPANLVTYFEFRLDCMRDGFVPRVNDEAATMDHVAETVPRILEPHFGDLDPTNRKASIDRAVATITSRTKDRNDYVLSTLVDDAVARAHDADPSLSSDITVPGLIAHKVASRIGWLDRLRRIELGKRLLSAAHTARNGTVQIVVHIQKKMGQVYLWIFTSSDRIERRKLLDLLCLSAQIKYGYGRVLGIITEPANGNGRSYDYWMADESIIAKPDQFPPDLLDMVPELESMSNLPDGLRRTD